MLSTITFVLLTIIYSVETYGGDKDALLTWGISVLILYILRELNLLNRGSL